MNVMLAGSAKAVQFSASFGEAAMRDSDRRIAQSLLSDTEFMHELKQLGIYDHDKASQSHPTGDKGEL